MVKVEHIAMDSNDFGIMEVDGYNLHFQLVEVDYDGSHCDLEDKTWCIQRSKSLVTTI